MLSANAAASPHVNYGVMRLTLIPRRRRDASVAALLLVLQALAGGVVALAHAGERTSAPVAIESHHDAHCLVLHDELRCALCHFAGAPLAPLVVRHAAPDFTLVDRRPAAADPAPPSHPDHLSAPPRAPPVTVS